LTARDQVLQRAQAVVVRGHKALGVEQRGRRQRLRARVPQAGTREQLGQRPAVAHIEDGFQPRLLARRDLAGAQHARKVARRPGLNVHHATAVA